MQSVHYPFQDKCFRKRIKNIISEYDIFSETINEFRYLKHDLGSKIYDHVLIASLVV